MSWTDQSIELRLLLHRHADGGGARPRSALLLSALRAALSSASRENVRERLRVLGDELRELRVGLRKLLQQHGNQLRLSLQHRAHLSSIQAHTTTHKHDSTSQTRKSTETTTGQA